PKDDDERREAGEGASWAPQAPEPTLVSRRTTGSVTVRAQGAPMERTEITPPPRALDDEPTPEPARPPVAPRRTTRPVSPPRPAAPPQREPRSILPTKEEL